jgi:uncharacterized protein (UPF0262 family)
LTNCDVLELLEDSPCDTLIAIFIGERTRVCPEVAAVGQKIGKVELRISITVKSEPTLIFYIASQKDGKVIRVILSSINEITENVSAISLICEEDLQFSS